MAWTKAKMVVVVASISVLTTIGTISVANHFRQGHPRQTGRLKMAAGDIKPMIAYSYSRVAVLLAADGSLWSWGENRLGWPVLGLQNTNVHNTTSLHRIGNDSDWVSIAAGDSHCLAIKSDGTLWGWGENLRYQLGDGTKQTQPTPVASIPGSKWKQAAAGGTESFAIKNDGTLWAWGNNWAGQLGIGSTKDQTNAVQVSVATKWEKIWAGDLQVVGLQSDGSLWFWGSLTGDANNANKFLIPTRVSPDTNWVDVCFGYFTVFAIKSDGTLWSWGNRARFYTQTHDASAALTPMQVGTDNDWQSCNAGPGGFYQLLTKKDNSLWALDASEHRTVKSDDQYKPVKFEKIKFPKDIAAYTAGGDNIGIVVTSDGEVWTWGRVMGELGPKDFFNDKGQPLYPAGRIVRKPWHLSFSDSFR